MFTKNVLRVTMLSGALVLAACGGGGDGGGSSSSSSSSSSSGGSSSSGSSSGGSAAISPGGFYSGSTVISGVTYQLYGVIDENGNARISEIQGAGPFAVIAPSAVIAPAAGGSFSNAGNIYAVAGFILDNGGTVESTTVSGTIFPRVSITGTSTNASGHNGTFTMQYQAARYEIPSSLATVAGTYNFSYSNGGQNITATIVISATGTISGSDGAGCNYSGSVKVPNAAYNAYDLTMTDSCLTGTITGLAVYDPSTNSGPAAVEVFASNSLNGFVLTLGKH